MKLSVKLNDDFVMVADEMPITFKATSVPAGLIFEDSEMTVAILYSVTEEYGTRIIISFVSGFHSGILCNKDFPDIRHYDDQRIAEEVNAVLEAESMRELV